MALDDGMQVKFVKAPDSRDMWLMYAAPMGPPTELWATVHEDFLSFLADPNERTAWWDRMQSGATIVCQLRLQA